MHCAPLSAIGSAIRSAIRALTRQLLQHPHHVVRTAAMGSALSSPPPYRTVPLARASRNAAHHPRRPFHHDRAVPHHCACRREAAGEQWPFPIVMGPTCPSSMLRIPTRAMAPGATALAHCLASLGNRGRLRSFRPQLRLRGSRPSSSLTITLSRNSQLQSLLKSLLPTYRRERTEVKPCLALRVSRSLLSKSLRHSATCAGCGGPLTKLQNQLSRPPVVAGRRAPSRASDVAPGTRVRRSARCRALRCGSRCGYARFSAWARDRDTPVVQSRSGSRRKRETRTLG